MMKDLIDKRNFIEKSQRSIVKGYNAHYLSEEELAEQRREENAKAARETYSRLRKEEALRIERENDAMVRAYDEKQAGILAGSMDEIPVTEEQIDRLLVEPSEELQTEELSETDAFVGGLGMEEVSSDDITIKEVPQRKQDEIEE